MYKPYSASEMFVFRGIPTFAELLRKSIYGSRRSVRDLKSETSKCSKTSLYQIVHTPESVFLIVELAITRSQMGLET